VRCAVRLTILISSLFLAQVCAWAQVSVSAKVVLGNHHQSGDEGIKDASEVVIWLSPSQALEKSGIDAPRSSYRMMQKDKQFTPHLLVVPTGSSVEFPNADPFFHNVFSLFNGKRFDLGLYESGTTRSVRFDREGVSYIFCNIHPQMAAVVLALSTPFYAVSQANGAAVIHDVPPGSYQLHVWSERATPVDLEESRRVVRVSDGPVNLGEILMESTASPIINHKNKFGEDYKPDPDSPY
jgi:plastocyanin